MRRGFRFISAISRELFPPDRRAIVLISSCVLMVQILNASDLKVSVTVSPVILLAVSDGEAEVVQGWGKNEAVVRIPLIRTSKQLLTVRAIASGQRSNEGCALAARLDNQVTTSVLINGKKLSHLEDTVLFNSMQYTSEEQLSLAVPQLQAAPGSTPSVILSCRPK